MAASKQLKTATVSGHFLIACNTGNDPPRHPADSFNLSTFCGTKIPVTKELPARLARSFYYA
jgi:hypothetical protein